MLTEPLADGQPDAAGSDVNEGGGRARILRTAADLFLSQGYAETSLRTIADAVDMRPASIYHHFDSKDALLSEILTIGIDAVSTAFDATTVAADDVGLAGRDRLLAHVGAHLRALFANHSFTATHVTVFPFVPDAVRAAAIGSRDGYEARWTHLLDGLAPGHDPDQLGLMRLGLLGALNSSVQWFDPGAGRSLDDLAETMVAMTWPGLTSGVGGS